jgi:tetratricopeptide (TPR) repeat protein
LSGLPLALTQAAAYIGQTAVSIDQNLEYYDNMWKDLMEQQDGCPLQEYAQRSVLTTWKISYEQVKSQSEEASNLLQLWSFLYAGDLWYELLSCTKEPKAETVVPDWLTVLAQNRLAFDGALRLLVKYSLVEGKIETASYAMHSVLHSWRRFLGESETKRDSYRKLAVIMVGNTVLSQSTKEYWVIQRRLLPHGQAVYDNIKSRAQAEINIDETGAWYYLATMFVDQERHVEAEAMYERALAGSEKALGFKHASTLHTIYSIGNLYADQGRLAEAALMYERALAGHEKSLAPNHTSTLRTADALAIMYHNQGLPQQRERPLDPTSKWNNLNNQRKPTSLPCLGAPNRIQIGQVSKARTVVPNVQLFPKVTKHIPGVEFRSE